MPELLEASAGATRAPGALRAVQPSCESLFAALDLAAEREAARRIQVAFESEADTAREPEQRALYAQVLLYYGDPDGALVEGERAARRRQTCITLYSHGRALAAVDDPQAAVGVLERALRVAENTRQPFWAAYSAHALATTRLNLGQYSQAADWAEWGLRIYRRERLDHPSLRVQLLAERSLALSLGDQERVVTIEQIREESAAAHGMQASVATRLQVHLAESALAHGHTNQALLLCERLWDMSTRREDLAFMTCVYVQAALLAGRPDQAQSAAERVLELSRGLHRIYRRWATLAHGIAFAYSQPRHAALTLRAALKDFRAPLVAPRVVQASLYLAYALLAAGDRAGAGVALEEAGHLLDGLSERGLAWLCPDGSVLGLLASVRASQVSPLELRFLGRTEARLGNQIITLRLRFAEIAASLAMHPNGLTLEQLALQVYGEDASLALCKTEVSRLRRILPIENRPYRLGIPVRADFLEVRELIRQGLLREALGLYQGSLLPRSDAPEVNAEREDLDVALRQAVLASGDTEAIWLLAERFPEDLEVWEEARERLARDDPRRFLAKARAARLEREWSDDELEHGHIQFGQAPDGQGRPRD